MPPNAETQFKNPAQAFDARVAAGNLLEAAVNEEITPRQALNRWPQVAVADNSLDAAYQALWYFEADEDRHRQEMFYLDAQLQLLSQMAGYLQQGRPLPDYMVQAYNVAFHTRFYEDRNSWRMPVARLESRCRNFMSLLRQTLALVGVGRV